MAVSVEAALNRLHVGPHWREPQVLPVLAQPARYANQLPIPRFADTRSGGWARALSWLLLLILLGRPSAGDVLKDLGADVYRLIDEPAEDVSQIRDGI